MGQLSSIGGNHPWRHNLPTWGPSATICIGHGIWINCLNQECLHRAKVDLAALVERYGPGLPVADLVKRAV